MINIIDVKNSSFYPDIRCELHHTYFPQILHRNRLSETALQRKK